MKILILPVFIGLFAVNTAYAGECPPPPALKQLQASIEAGDSAPIWKFIKDNKLPLNPGHFAALLIDNNGDVNLAAEEYEKLLATSKVPDRLDAREAAKCFDIEV